MNSQEINKFIKENVDKIYHEMVKVRRIIHENPELGDEEFETSKLIKKFLTENGIEFFEIINNGYRENACLRTRCTYNYSAWSS